MNNRNLEYDPPHAEMVYDALKSLEDKRGAPGFLNAILEATPNGEWIRVQYHPNGDWSVAAKPESDTELTRLTREAMAKGVKTSNLVLPVLNGEWDDTPLFRATYGELWLERNR